MFGTLKRIAKKILANRVFKAVYDAVNIVVLEVFGWSRVLTHLYYTVLPLAFNREQAAVFRGRRNYYRDKFRPSVTHVGLRRNVHRIEKALIMKNRRPVFAADYIGETVTFYAASIGKSESSMGSMELSELQWAHDVLAEYFAAVDSSNSRVNEARDRFVAIGSPESSKSAKVPYVKKKNTGISYDQFLTLTENRRSVRWFQQKPVPREVIDKAMLAARQSPSACNRLPYEFRVFDEKALVQRVASIPFGTAGWDDQIPTIVVVVGKLSSYFSPRDRHALYIDSSLAAMSFIFALETQGLSSTIINWPDLEPVEAQMQKLLGLDFTDRVVMLIAVGYADTTASVPFSQKKELDTIRSYNKLPGATS
jgi:nitroreductase